MRLEGFEPPTRGLEGRRSSTELQAPTAQRTGETHMPRDITGAGETGRAVRVDDEFFLPALPLPSWHSSEW